MVNNCAVDDDNVHQLFANLLHKGFYLDVTVAVIKKVRHFLLPSFWVIEKC